MELEDLSFRYLEEDAYKQIAMALAERRKTERNTFGNWLIQFSRP